MRLDGRWPETVWRVSSEGNLDLLSVVDWNLVLSSTQRFRGIVYPLAEVRLTSAPQGMTVEPTVELYMVGRLVYRLVLISEINGKDTIASLVRSLFDQVCLEATWSCQGIS